MHAWIVLNGCGHDLAFTHIYSVWRMMARIEKERAREEGYQKRKYVRKRERKVTKKESM